MIYREKAYRINMVKSHLPCSSACCSKSCSLSSCKFSKSSPPNDGDRKQVVQEKINKYYIKQYLKSKQLVPKGATCHYEHVSAIIT
jgi:hypothetical protein